LFLELAEGFKDSWNYGNAIHNANLVLGICAYDTGDFEAAKACLEKAGNSPGSPQLNSFGPNMQLAKRLLNTGEYESVLSYLDSCEKFWKSGGEWLRIWKQKVSNKQVPKFYMHLYV
jgi:tetratricopeptide (TPR) repeat protein